ncbi:hypothetical protein Dsin_021727 [Dipteronia sinensis]|uniref:Zinc finger PMZ-type domain-containing protein n=1 Tax=Dipteronia sinensis TaxID=43782 RepID=A0AAE0E0H8_9ROSI|nr:hypothetical protein Dsin_021727 [Dipteronia sinensis]
MEVKSVVNVDLTRFTIELRTLADTGVRLRPARPKIKDDSDVEMLLCDDGHVSEVYVSSLEKVSAEPGNLTRLITSVNPVISEDPTIDEVVADPYNEDDRSILEYNSQSEYGLDKGMNDVPLHYHGMSSDPTDGCHTGSVPPVFTSPSRDTFEDDGINVGDRSGTAVPKKDLKKALLTYALKENFEIRVTRSSTTRYEAGCKDLECKFQIREVKIEGGNYWIVQILEEDHSCTINELHNRYCQASAWFIVEILSPKLAVSGLSLKPKEIMTDMQVLPAYCHQLKCVNLGTVTTIKIDTAQKFEYLFTALSASLERFYTAIRHAICIDAIHLKGKFCAVMFIVACQDANNQVFPLAYGWGDVECKDSWTWFLKELKKAIGYPANCIIISDRSHAIKVAMAKKYPEITHGLCGFYMNMNLKNRFKSHVVYNLFGESFKGTSRIRVLREDAGVEPRKQYTLQLPITTLVEYIRDMMQKWFHERRDDTSKNATLLSHWSTDKVSKKNENSHKYTVCPIDHVNFNVNDGEKDGLVNLSEKTCSCREFQNDLLPYSHALAAIRFCKKKFVDFSSDFYKTSTWLKNYSGDTQASGILLKKNVLKLFFHQSGELRLVGQKRIGFYLQASMVIGVGTVPSARNLATTDKIVQTPCRSAKQCSEPTNRSTTALTS